MSAPFVVHRLSSTGGRRGAVRGESLGLAYDDLDLALASLLMRA
ncbi:hypothetical protein ACWFRJ_00935 [Streptomyces sp. NPDC055239]